MKELSFDELISFEALYKAHTVARCSKRQKWDVIAFENNLFSNLTKLEQSLKNGEYKVGNYKKFTIHEPKEREIEALGYPDRVVQHTICDNFLTPYYDRRLIYANCACRIGKGSHFARKLLKSYFVNFIKHHKKGYILKCDIKKYFANINHEQLYKIIDKIKDKKVVTLLKVIIESYNSDIGVGLPIGNQVSQIMGIVYLDKIDRLIKEQLRIKYYVRYMDDLILIHESKEYLKQCFEKINKVLSSLKLEFNKKTQFLRISQGVEFLGAKYVVKDNKVLQFIKKQSKKKFIKNKKNLAILKAHSLISKDYIKSSTAGIKGHTKGFNCHRLLPKIMP